MQVFSGVADTLALAHSISLVADGVVREMSKEIDNEPLLDDARIPAV